MMSSTDLLRLHQAFDSTHSIKGAARLMNVSVEAVKAEIARYPELRSYLPNCEPPDESEAIAVVTSPPVDEPTAKEVQLAAASKRADAQLRRGLEGIGIKDPASLEQVIAFRDFGKLHFESMRHYMSGGIAKLFADLMADIQDVREEIGQTLMSDEVSIAASKALREDRSRLVEHVLKTYDRAREAALTAAAIELKKKEAQEGRKNQSAKPGFQPLLAMKVEGNVSVTSPQTTHA